MNKDVLLQSLVTAFPEKDRGILLQTIICRQRKTSSTLTSSFFFELSSLGGGDDPSTLRIFSANVRTTRIVPKG